MFSKESLAIITAYVLSTFVVSLLLGYLVSTEAQIIFIPFSFFGGIAIGVWRASVDY